jgi:integrase/recombinase XerD
MKGAHSMISYRDAFIRELKNRRYAPNTIKAYGGCPERFLEYKAKTTLKPRERISRFLSMHDSQEKRRIAWNAIKLFYDPVLGRPCPYTIDKIRPRHRLPSFLDRSDVLLLFSRIRNPKHRLMISMLYGSGIRVSELVRIRIRDLDFPSLTVRIVNAKQNKDRITVFAESLAEDLKANVRGRDGNEYVFLTTNRKPCTRRTVQAVFAKALRESSIRKRSS